MTQKTKSPKKKEEPSRSVQKDRKPLPDPTRVEVDPTSPAPLVSNGLDFVHHAVELLEHSHSDREARHAVVFLAIGVELLLKSRLVREHWSLVFENVDKANLKALRDGSLNSVGAARSLERLTEACRVALSKRAIEAIKGLWDYRNQVVHFHTQVSIDALKVKAFEVLSELTDFVWNECELNVDDQKRANEIETQLLSLDKYRKKRLMAVSTAISELPDGGYFCPICEQRAVDVRDNTCVFCHTPHAFMDLTDTHMTRVLGHREFRDYGRDYALCHICDWADVVRVSPEDETMRCLDCKQLTQQRDLRRCRVCDHWVTAMPGADVHCPDCKGTLPLENSVAQ